MDLTVYDVIIGPVVTEKAYRLNQILKQLVIKVHPDANKPLIKEALKKVFNIEADAVRIVVSKGKFRRVGRHVVKGKLKKKAIITLKAGSSVDVAGLANNPVMNQQSSEVNAGN